MAGTIEEPIGTRPADGRGVGGGRAVEGAALAAVQADARSLLAPEDLPGASDDLLVRAALAGQSEAFDGLVRRYTNMIFCFLNARLRDDVEAEEITQETMVRAYVGLPRLRAPRAFPSWLFTIAGAVLADRVRAGSKVVPLEEEHESGGAPVQSPAELFSREESRAMVHREIQRLPSHYRVALTLKHLDNLSVEEISKRLQVPAGTVRSRLSRSYALLHKGLSGRGLGAAAPEAGPGFGETEKEV